MILLLVLYILNNVVSLNEDKVKYLPGLKENVTFNHYSGYLHASTNTNLHYWFVECTSDPKECPVVLWLNGGPGCSSLDGLLNELGPFLVNNSGTSLYMNPFSWNSIANIIFMESPAGVGFSYSSNDSKTTFTDDEVSNDNLLALHHFFQKYPQFQENDLYVIGESYGGIYVPTLAERIVKDTSNRLNLKGIGIGNGLLSQSLNIQSLVYYAYYHGLFSDELWRELRRGCCSADVCNFHHPKNSLCSSSVSKVMQMIYDIGINTYSLYQPCRYDVGKSQRVAVMYKNIFAPFINPGLTNRIQQTLNDDDRILLKVKNEISCIDSYSIEKWLNTPEVKDALNIDKDFKKKWSTCNLDINKNYITQYENMSSQFQTILASGIKILVYNGDTDMACNFLGNQWFITSLFPNASTHYARNPWYVDEQVAGFVRYLPNLTFATVKGAGHMVPQWKPKQALYLIQSWIHNKPL